mmetsp:Transcript_35215/g.80372  ORF Transcript_35215/g.80372 Transcript_35215/m.80372 type:complete len:211 (-) Transcript_35215:1456-2088(-)
MHPILRPRCLVSNNADSSKLSKSVREVPTRRRNEHEVFPNTKTLRDGLKRLWVEGCVRKHKVEPAFGVAFTECGHGGSELPQLRRLWVIVAVHNLHPISQFVVLNIDGCLGQQRQISVLGEEDGESVVLHFVQQALHVWHNLVGELRGCLRQEIEKKTEQTGALKHQVHRPGDYNKVEHEVHEVERSDVNVADQRGDDCNRSHNTHPPGR